MNFSLVFFFVLFRTLLFLIFWTNYFVVLVLIQFLLPFIYFLDFWSIGQYIRSTQYLPVKVQQRFEPVTLHIGRLSNVHCAKSVVTLLHIYSNNEIAFKSVTKIFTNVPSLQHVLPLVLHQNLIIITILLLITPT